ncbi:TonB-dependent siderophore receptor [Phenylobacterium sp.]|uniref:TonB-dependent siderophore receptor n=1 Tax=Phenylobacterium sp. TaxID=1871053 RepID=UPI0035B3F9EC
MVSFSRSLLLAGVAACALSGAARAEEADAADAPTVSGVVVEGARAESTAATGLDLTLKETPQSVSVLTAEQIDAFALDTANDLLAFVPGINVEKVETDRTYYNARGFDITNFQVDGLGLPLIWGIQFGDLDTAMFEKVEAVKGANALMTGTGNPSATINYVRKRPTDTFQGELSAQIGSWDDRRVEADVSGPLNAAGTVRGRMVLAGQDRDSYLDHYGVRRDVEYGVLSWDVTPRLTLTGGYSRQDNRATGVLWGALPLLYADGTRISYPTSASTSADWTHWNVEDQTAFGEAVYAFDGGWKIKGVATYKRFEENAQLLYAYGAPDPATGLGVYGMSGIYPSLYEQYMADVQASGPFSLFGRTHELVVGAHASRAEGKEWENFSADTLVYPAVDEWGQMQVAEPSYPGAYLAARSTERLRRLYAAAHLNLTDRLKAVAGVSWAQLKTRGYSYGTDTTRDEDKASPYAGLVFDLTPNLALYASYTDIFNPQSEIDINQQRLAPAHGKAYEGGIKSQWLDGRLYATAAVFKSEQDGLAEYAGVLPNLKSYYVGVDTVVKGFELEAAGRLTDRWSLNGGYTDLSIEDGDGNTARTYIPRRTFKLATTYQIPELRNLKLGAAVRWQSDVHIVDLATIEQPAWTELDLSAAVDLSDHVRATLVVKNATDETHLTSLMWNQSYYAAPRSAYFKLAYTF